MKLYDFDGMFDEKLAEYIKKNADKYRESEWEDIIPKLYEKFGDTVIKSLGVTPNGFYAAMDDAQLVKCLRAHIKQGVPVSEYLCRAVESRDCKPLLMPMLSGTREEIVYAVNVLGACEEALGDYMRIITSAADEDLANICIEEVKELADLACESAISYYEKGVCKAYMLEILSRVTRRDDRVFEILLKEFRTDGENICMNASYLAAYGDERALPYLYEAIEEEGISYAEFQELKYAIEALGGSYEKERDFSADPYYQLISAHAAIDFSDFKNKK